MKNFEKKICLAMIRNAYFKIFSLCISLQAVLVKIRPDKTSDLVRTQAVRQCDGILKIIFQNSLF